MEILTFLTFLIVLALLIIIINNNSGLHSRIDKLSKEISLLKSSLQRPEQVVNQPKPEKKASDIGSVEMAATSIKKETIADEKKQVPQEPSKPEPAVIRQTIVQPSNAARPAPAPRKPKPPTDFEKVIGENLVSKIGIIILVLGVGFFVKYAIDQNWINEYGRTAIGLLVGGALIGVAHYIRKSYKTFSSLLTGGGIAVFYLTITIAFHQYQLFSQGVAFMLLVVITVFSVILSLIYDKKELAIFSQIGGYLAPFMVSTGEGNYIVLFTYLLILSAGLIALAYFKRWHILNILAFVFTVIIYTSWLGKTFWDPTNPPYTGALIYASLFYLVFFLVNVLNNIKERKSFNGIEIAMILTNNVFYFLSGLAILHSLQDGVFKGLFTVIIGVYNFGWVLFLYRRKQIDKNFIYLLIGLVMSYISIAVPIQLNGHSITLFWSAEFVLLLWLSQVSGIKLLKIGHLAVMALAIISLMMDWSKLYGDNQIIMPIVLNQAFVTGFILLTGVVLTRYFLRKETDESFVKYFLSVKEYNVVLIFLVSLFAYLVLFLELQYQMNNYYDVMQFRHVVYGIYNFGYLFGLLYVIRKFDWKTTFIVFFNIALASLFIYLIYYNVMVLQTRYQYFYTHSLSLGNFLFHYLVYPFIAGIILILFKERDKVFATNSFWSKAFIWYLTFYTIFILSTELDNLLLLIFKTSSESIYSILRISHKVGYPILWAISAFVLILWGIRYKVKNYRIIALSLLGLILLKLFFIDVWSMNEGGRIAAFIFLGIVLLIISFLYQKLKRFLLENESNNPTAGNQ